MALTLYPAMDLLDGACVRLAQGDFARKTIYSADPEATAACFEKAGAKHLHLVDLEGARDATKRQKALIARIVRSTSLMVQAGGGVRTAGDVAELLELGIERVVIGSLAVANREETARIIERFGAGRITLALDVAIDAQDIPRVAIHGWKEASPHALDDVLSAYVALGISRVLCTDIRRDGMLSGSNLDLYIKILQQHPKLELLASGGIRSLEDLSTLARAGIPGAIIGRAIYEKKIDLAEAVLAC